MTAYLRSASSISAVTVGSVGRLRVSGDIEEVRCCGGHRVFDAAFVASTSDPLACVAWVIV